MLALTGALHFPLVPLSIGAKLIEPPGECRSNHAVLQGLAKRLGAVHPAFDMAPSSAPPITGRNIPLRNLRC